MIKGKILAVILIWMSWGLSNVVSQTTVENPSSTETALKHHVSLDAGGLLDLVFNSSGTGNSPLFVSWRKLGEKSNRRMGFGISASFQSAASQNSGYFTISYSIGKERFRDFSRRWQVFYGWDFLTQVSTQRFGENSETGFSLGWGPLAGIHFKINEHLWISTEANIMLLTGYDINSDKVGSFGLQTRFEPPSTIFLGYRF